LVGICGRVILGDGPSIYACSKFPGTLGKRLGQSTTWVGATSWLDPYGIEDGTQFSKVLLFGEPGIVGFDVVRAKSESSRYRHHICVVNIERKTSVGSELVEGFLVDRNCLAFHGTPSTNRYR
jgi:hypothetical protein